MIELKENGFPVMNNLIIFRKFEEIPEAHLNVNGKEKRWAMRGFDDRVSIFDIPYKWKNYTKHGFTGEEAKKIFEETNNEMDKDNIPKENRIFLICDVFFSDEVIFSGHAHYNGEEIVIDVLNGNRPSGRDLTPDFSVKVPIINNKLMLKQLHDSKYSEHLIQICEDIRKFHNRCYLDLQ